MTTKRSKRSAPAAPEAFLEDYPPFPGFDPAAFKFLRDLKRNNRREWLTPERKEIYQAHLLEPMRCLLAELRTRFVAEDLPFAPDPKRGIFRIYRDTRFRKDKTPFKTNIGAAIPFADESKEGVGNYLHIEPGECFYGGGAYFIDSGGLKRLRAAIDRDPDRLRAILRDLSDAFAPLEGEQLKRAPAGYPEDHPAIDLLRYKQMWAGRSFPDELASSRDLIDRIVEWTRNTVEFDRYLYEAMKGAKG
jgi:uncharacterized protein (TIGR02453 family)